MGEATIRLSRAASASPLLGMEKYNISIDGRVVGAIAAGETVEVAVASGRHSLLLRGRGRNRSPLRALELADDEVGELPLPRSPVRPASCRGGTDQAKSLDQPQAGVAIGVRCGPKPDVPQDLGSAE